METAHNESRGTTHEIKNLSKKERHNFRMRVASDAFRGFVAFVAAIFMLTSFGWMVYQQNVMATTLEKLDKTYTATTSLSDISVLAAFCANLPESTTVAKIRQCIETNLEKITK